jgi:hypothetical protein
MMMKVRLYKGDHRFMRHYALDNDTTMGHLIRQAIARVLVGEFEVEDKGESVSSSINIPESDEQQLKDIATRAGVSVDEIVRQAVNDTIGKLKAAIAAGEHIFEKDETRVERERAIAEREQALVMRHTGVPNELKKKYRKIMDNADMG